MLFVCKLAVFDKTYDYDFPFFLSGYHFFNINLYNKLTKLTAQL